MNFSHTPERLTITCDEAERAALRDFQSVAEKESDYQERWRAGQRIADEIEDLQNRRTALYSEARDFIADLRRAAAGACKDSAVWRHIVKLRKLAASLAATIADKAEQLKLYPEYE